MNRPTEGRRTASGHRLGAWHQATRDDDATVRRARELRDSGKTYAEITTELSVPYFTVRDWVTYRTRADA